MSPDYTNSCGRYHDKHVLVQWHQFNSPQWGKRQSQLSH